MAVPEPPRRRCLTCSKRAFDTERLAREEVLRALVDSRVYLEEYRCPRTHDGGWHVRNIEKRERALHAKGDGLGTKSRFNLARLRGLTDRQDGDPKDTSGRRTHAPRTPSVDWRMHHVPEGRAARARRHNRFRRPRRYHWRNPTPRADCPQGGTLMKMMAWANGTSYCHADFHPRYRKGEEIRRRNRKREKEVWHREVRRDLAERSRMLPR